LRAVGFAGIEAVHALVVDGIDVGTFCSKDWDIDEWDENDGSGDLGGIEGGDELFNGDDGGVFGAVGAEMSARTLPGLAPFTTTTGMFVAASTPAGTSR